MEDQPSSIDIRDLLWRVRKDFWVLALPVVLVLCGAILYLRFTPRQYVSSMVVSIGDKASLSRTLDPLINTDQDRDQPEARAAALQSRIFSRPFLLEVGQRMGLDKSTALKEEAQKQVSRLRGVTLEDYTGRLMVERLTARIRVAPVQGALVRISASDEFPTFALRLANAVGDVLLDQSRRNTVRAAQQRSEFSSDQVSVYEERLRKSEAALRDFQESIVGRRLSSSVVRDTNVDEARQLLQEIDEEVDQARGRIQRGQTQVGTADLPRLESRNSNALESRLSQLEVNLAVTSLGTSTPTDLAASKSRIVETRQALFSEYQALAQSSGGASDDVAGIAAAVALDRSILKSLRAKRSRVEGMISEYSRGVAATPRNQMELERLQSEVSANRDLLLSLQKEATSSRISEALGVSQLGIPVDIVEPPMLPLTPASPDRVKILGAAIILGPMLAIGLLMGLERLSGVVKSAEQAESELGAQVIGTIPLVLGWRRPGSVLRNHWAVMAVTLVLLVTGVAYVARNALRSIGRTPSASSHLEP